VVGETLQARLEAQGLVVPDGLTITSPGERPDLAHLFGGDAEIWAPFMLEDPVAHEGFDVAHEAYPDFQLLLLDGDERLLARANAMPLAWSGLEDDLPDGWDDQVLRSLADLRSGAVVNTLGAMVIVVMPGARGGGYAGTMVGAFRAAAAATGLSALIACVRPTEKERYPLLSIDRYAEWKRADGLPFDPWIRLHVRMGGRIVRPSPRSMTVRGSIRDWESWTGLSFPASGPYVIAGGTSPVRIDLEADEGVYHDQNVWVVHDLGF
jgi:hypothetical protein